MRSSNSFGLIVASAAVCCAQQLTPVWVEVGDAGHAFARVVVEKPADCPTAQVDGTSAAMKLRAPVPANHRPVCELAIPAAAKTLAVGSQTLALPHPDPTRVVALGDTGCRIKGPRAQDCSDPIKWPFLNIAVRAAAAKPDLVIHVGDFIYREENCPSGSEAKCGGTPIGDRWETWDADFFKPAAALLRAAPWAFSRGNHEDCTRAWAGWFYYLDPHPWSGGKCQSYPPPYVVKLGAFELVMFDSSTAADEVAVKDQIDRYAAQLSSVHVQHAWLVDHHPFWGLRIDKGSKAPAAISAPLESAWEKASPKGIELILSGHTHLFEVLSFDQKWPPQVVVGDGGTDLAEALPTKLNGITVRGATIAGSENSHDWGYTLFTKSEAGWHLELKSPQDAVFVTCDIAGNKVTCPPSKQ
jgi:hypothetical protein